ncbi:histone-lysine N-methyltransferase, H3 lysine-9 specific SUVH4 isoform X2 [Malania oleifera]|uniref:histone-lysine N-methyltransferase, H3 lysine-9 specific SUVH4 isoform X2 n=1 Tax=Malania oleifera TaxID=397392 RepID=UPI0025AE8A12|nr:histone-lysine N-methyltransferase, H3 lysine-9 specific SUVH4 isoform X2 [Malania oleifera]
MVAQSLCCMNTVYDRVDSPGVDQRVAVDDECFMVSDVKGGVDTPVDTDGASSGRRTSARIRERLKNKEAILPANHVRHTEESAARSKKIKVYHRRKGKAQNAGAETMEQRVPDIGSEALNLNEAVDAAYVQGLQGVAEKGIVGEGALANGVEISVHAKVKETIRTFNKHFLHFVQEEEKRCKKVEIEQKRVQGSKSKNGDSPEKNLKRSAKRPDLKAITKMIETNSILYPAKQFGPIPGVDVGYQFFSRAEMVAVGFHCHWLNGIDYMGKSYEREYVGYTFPLAVSIVMSGQYEDDLDNSEDVVYTGQGGSKLLGNSHRVHDQVLERGNLALKHSMDQCVPVRVVRGHGSASSYVGKVYTYDGLYKVVQHWAEKGVSGFTVFKYRLRRLEGQPILTTNQVLYRGRAPKSISEIRGLVCEDITGGEEDIPIPATNLIDDPPVAPAGYKYCKSIQVSKSVKVPTNATGCDCKGTCIDPSTCACAKLNGSDFPYVHRDGGRLIEAKAVVFECGPKCGCGPGCVNRTSQRGLKHRLEVFRTPRKGWAVRSWDYIPSGAPVCEYTGVLTRTDELNADTDNNYIFDIDCLQTMKGLDGRERRLRDVSMPLSNHLEKPDDQKSECVPEFCIDAGSIGNIARFINHSCEPNLFVQCVLSSHQDFKLARVMLFAADNIPPMQRRDFAAVTLWPEVCSCGNPS